MSANENNPGSGTIYFFYPKLPKIVHLNLQENILSFFRI